MYEPCWIILESSAGDATAGDVCPKPSGVLGELEYAECGLGGRAEPMDATCERENEAGAAAATW